MASISRYDEALQFLFGRLNYERTEPPTDRNTSFKLSRMRELVQRLGNPHRQVPVVHVAGTKGKGSTAALIASVLQASGYKTGLFCSPHLYRVEERLTIDSVQAGEDDLVELIQRIRPQVEQMDRRAGSLAGPTYFEITTAMAMLHFVHQQVDAAVLEVGLGGRLDSTNVCLPEVSVITSISRDHTKQLGNSLTKIATEKAGIVKAAVPLVNGAVHPAAKRAIAEICAQRSAPLRQLGEHFRFAYHPPRPATRTQAKLQSTPTSNGALGAPELLTGSVDVQTWGRHWPDLRLAMLGRHQAANCAVAVAVLETLAEKGWTIPDAAVRKGLHAACLPARVEVIASNPTVVIDAAHNGASVRSLLQTLHSCFCPQRRILVFATTRDKDVPGMMRQVVPFFDAVVVTRYQNNPRGVDPGHLADLAARLGHQDVVLRMTPADAWQCALELAAPQDLICVAGSFFIAAEMRTFALDLRHAAPREPLAVLNH